MGSTRDRPRIKQTTRRVPFPLHQAHIVIPKYPFNSPNTPNTDIQAPKKMPTTGESVMFRWVWFQAMQTLLQQLHANLGRALAGGGVAATKRHTARGKLLPRERIGGILDTGSPFLELSPLAGKDLYGEQCSRHHTQAHRVSALGMRHPVQSPTT